MNVLCGPHHLPGSALSASHAERRLWAPSAHPGMGRRCLCRGWHRTPCLWLLHGQGLLGEARARPARTKPWHRPGGLSLPCLRPWERPPCLCFTAPSEHLVSRRLPHLSPRQASRVKRSRQLERPWARGGVWATRPRQPSRSPRSELRRARWTVRPGNEQARGQPGDGAAVTAPLLQVRKVLSPHFVPFMNHLVGQRPRGPCRPRPPGVRELA